MNKITKLNFFLKRPRIIIVSGQNRACAAEAIFQVLRQHFEVRKITDDLLPWVKRKEVLIFESAIKESKTFEFLVKKSRLPLLVVTRVGEYHPDREFFAGEKALLSGVTELLKVLPAYAYSILNFDDEAVRDLKGKMRAHPLTFGFGVRADMRATDIVLTQAPALGTNFKINYEGNIVPVWLEKLFSKDQIYTALATAAVGQVLGLNLVAISGALKFYQSLPGKMRLIEGIKNSWILDDSANASAFSMLEALGILKKIAGERKIAVLGDILGVGKYAIEAHETIGERVRSCADLLFTVGARAKFFAQGALKRGMAEDKIFQFNKSGEVGRALQEEMREGDLILVDGSKEMKMAEIIDEVKFIK